jgi:hypothetical protein
LLIACSLSVGRNRGRSGRTLACLCPCVEERMYTAAFPLEVIGLPVMVGCRSCGKTIGLDAASCPYCGWTVGTEIVSSVPTKSGRRLLLGLIVLLTSLAGLYWLWDQPSAVSVPADPMIGTRRHITGCENGKVVVPVVNLWNSPSRTRVVGTLSGEGGPDGCQGAVVVIRAVRGNFYEVEAVAGRQAGWVTEPFVGRLVD